MTQLRTAWISDVHLGTKGSNAAALLRFLRDYEFETLYVVGDFIDVWSLKRAIHWPQLHNDVIQKVLRKGRKGSRVIYIPGNHDEFVASFFGSYGSIEIRKHAIHETADGRRLLVMHGHELDTVIQTMKWMAFVGDVGYQLLLRLNGPVNRVRKMLGMEYWSLSQHVKKSVKDAVSFIGRFEEAVVRYAKDYEVGGVVCGHIHTPLIRNIGDFEYYNTGDWVESCTALIEHTDGRMELVCELPREHRGVEAVPEPPEDPEEEPAAPIPAQLAGSSRGVAAP